MMNNFMDFIYTEQSKIVEKFMIMKDQYNHNEEILIILDEQDLVTEKKEELLEELVEFTDYEIGLLKLTPIEGAEKYLKKQLGQAISARYNITKK